MYVELLLQKGDCPENKEFPEIQFCPGDCQGTYLSVIAKDDELRPIGGIYSKPHIMYNEEFAREHNLEKEEIAAYVKNYLEHNPFTSKTYMDGRKKRIYVKGKHVQTLFEGCVFRIAQGDFVAFLNKLRKKELDEITRNLEAIKKIAFLM